MTWRLQFYNGRRGILTRHDVEALLPAQAVRSGWTAFLAEYPSAARRRRPSLFDQAQRVGGQDSGGWVLYRIAKDGEPGIPGAVLAPAA